LIEISPEDFCRKLTQPSCSNNNFLASHPRKVFILNHQYQPSFIWATQFRVDSQKTTQDEKSIEQLHALAQEQRSNGPNMPNLRKP
jgi:hypothetical protein